MRRTIIPVLLLTLSFNVQVSFAQTGAKRAPAAQNAADRGWPRGYSLPSEAQIVLYQPQIANWDNQKHLVAYAAVSHVVKGEQKPALGTIKFETDTEVSLEQRLVKFSQLKITETNFQTLSKEQTQEIVTELEKNLPDEERIIALDRVLEAIRVDDQAAVVRDRELAAVDLAGRAVDANLAAGERHRGVLAAVGRLGAQPVWAGHHQCAGDAEDEHGEARASRGHGVSP